MLRPPESNRRSAWQELEKLLDETSQLAIDSPSTDEFHRELLSRAMPALAASGAAIWNLDCDGRLRLATTQGLFADVLADPTARSEHETLLRAKLNQTSEQPLRIDAPAWLTKGLCALAATAREGDENYAVLEILAACEEDAATRKSQFNILLAFNEILSDFHRRRAVSELRRAINRWELRNKCFLNIHARTGKREICYALAEELHLCR